MIPRFCSSLMPANHPDQMLTYRIHIERAFEGLVELGYLEVTKFGFFDRRGRKGGTHTSRLSRYVASDRLLGLFTADELKALPAIIPSYADPELIWVRVNHTRKPMQKQQGGNAILCDVTKTARSYMTGIDIGDNNA